MSKSPKFKDSTKGIFSELEEIKQIESKIQDNVAYILIQRVHETLNYKFDFNNHIIFQALTNLGYKMEDFSFKFTKTNLNSQDFKNRLKALKIEEAIYKLKDEISKISISLI